MQKDTIFLTSDNYKISITSFGEISKDKPAIIVTHGFKGFKDWGFFPHAAGYLSSLGFFVLTFNFSHNGIGNIKDQFTEIEKFGGNTFSREVDELVQITNSLKTGYFEGIIPKSVGILGHSRGGGIAILSAPLINIDCLVTWAAVAKLDRYSDRQKNEWREKGYHLVTNARTGQEFKIKLSFLNDIEQNKNDKLNIEKSVQMIKAPYLIIHGSEDQTVKSNEAQMIYNWSNKETSSIEIIKSAGHTFNIVHPFAGSNTVFEDVLKMTGDYFIKNL
jgi:dienelactone hydrolase